MNKIMFIGSFPPPNTGLSIACNSLYKYLEGSYELIKIDMSKNNLSSGNASINQFKNVFKKILFIYLNRKVCEYAYITITQSVYGNLKDLIYIYLLRKKKVIVHLHGGGFSKQILSKSILKNLNKVIYKNVDFGIVLGESLRNQLSPILNNQKIKVVENFYLDYFLLEKEKIKNKFNKDVLIITYLSNLIESKGFNYLLEASKYFKDDKKVYFNFVGEFENNNIYETYKKFFSDTVKYYGKLDSFNASKILKESHVFCLPTYYKYEGQPISILEAYAAGNVVMTTDQGGIKDVFKDLENGFELKKKSTNSIIEAIKKFQKMTINEKIKIANYNNTIALENYKEEIYLKKVESILFHK